MTLIWDHLINKGIRISLIVAAASGLLFSCASNSGTPEWLSSYPSDSAFYVGIGGSNTGNMADDREKATASARADLAAQISTQVKSELDIASSASSEGDFSESVKQTITESVEQNLQSVETVDTWFSPEQGAWAYVRLSKAVWAAIVKREVTDLTLRANTTLQPVAAGTMTETEEMAALGRARLALQASAWGPRVKDEVLSTGGFLMEAVDRAISERVAGLEIVLAVEPALVEYGDEVQVRGSVVSGSGRTTGSYPLLMFTPDGESFLVTSNSAGNFRITLQSADLGLNSQSLVVTPDLNTWEIPAKGFPVTETKTDLFVAPIPVTFTVNSDVTEDLINQNGAVNDWFSDLNLPVTVGTDSANSINIEFAWTVFDYPRYEKLPNAPYIAGVGAIITLRRGDTVISVHDLEEIKDGGLDFFQAHNRAADFLLAGTYQSLEIAESLLESLAK